MRVFCFFLVFIGAFSSFSQNKEMDSLYANLGKFHEDTNLVNTYNQLAQKLHNSKLEMSLFFAEKAMALSDKLKFKQGLVNAYTNVGISYYYKGKYTTSLIYHTKAAKILEKEKDKKRLSSVYNNIALVYLGLNKYNSSESYFLKSLNLEKERKDYVGMGDSYNNLGTIYKEQKMFTKALSYFNRSLYFRNLGKDSLGLPSTLANLGAINIIRGNYSEANKQLYGALALYKKHHEVFGNALIYNSLGDLKIAEKKYKEAISLYSKSLEVAKKNNMQSYICYSYKWMSFAYEKLHDYRKAYQYHLKYTRINNQIYNSENSALLAEIQTKYETEKHKKQIIQSRAQLNRQNTLTNIFIIGFIFMLVMVFFILKSYKMKIRNNKIILEQKQAVEEKNKIIEEKSQLVESQNKDIKDSIKYAERIQGAILPPKNLWNSILPNSFVFYQPKDILSGDFYWIAETDEFKFIAAADCTGHGVPGALISIVNYNLLNKAVLEKNITKPGEILDAVNIWLTESLHQTTENSTVKDGMDISLISIHKETNQIEFSGANNPLFVLTNDEIKEYKGDKFPVGSFVEEQTLSFRTISIDVNKGDMLYLFSDGFADQFGGDKGKKFKLSNLREEFKLAKDIPIVEQKSFLHKRFTEWKGNLEQVDDVMIIGIEL